MTSTSDSNKILQLQSSLTHLANTISALQREVEKQRIVIQYLAERCGISSEDEVLKILLKDATKNNSRSIPVGSSLSPDVTPQNTPYNSPAKPKRTKAGSAIHPSTPPANLSISKLSTELVDSSPKDITESPPLLVRHSDSLLQTNLRKATLYSTIRKAKPPPPNPPGEENSNEHKTSAEVEQKVDEGKRRFTKGYLTLPRRGNKLAILSEGNNDKETRNDRKKMTVTTFSPPKQFDIDAMRSRCPIFNLVAVIKLQDSPSGPLEQMEYVFPPQEEGKKPDPILASLGQFCFPDKLEFSKDRHLYIVAQDFPFVLTVDNGQRRVGYCRRFRDKMPVCFCIISVLQAPRLFHQIMEIIVELYHSLKKTEAVTQFLTALQKKPFPFLGETFPVLYTSPYTDAPEMAQFTYYQESQLDLMDLQTLLSHLRAEHVVAVFVSLLVERRILFYSGDITTLCNSVQALVAMIYPLSWQHIYIPVLPPSLLSYCCAPMPFCIGVMKTHIDEVHKLPMEEVLIVDLDGDKLFCTEFNDYCLLPDNVLAGLEKPLKSLERCVKKLRETPLRQKDKDEIKHRKEKIAERFMEFFVSLLAFYQYDIKPDGTLDKEAFLDSCVSEMKSAYSLFVMSQIFERFVQERSARVNSQQRNPFESRLTQYEQAVSKGVAKKWCFRKKSLPPS